MREKGKERGKERERKFNQRKNVSLHPFCQNEKKYIFECSLFSVHFLPIFFLLLFHLSSEKRERKKERKKDKEFFSSSVNFLLSFSFLTHNFRFFLQQNGRKSKRTKYNGREREKNNEKEREKNNEKERVRKEKEGK